MDALKGIILLFPHPAFGGHSAVFRHRMALIPGIIQNLLILFLKFKHFNVKFNRIPVLKLIDERLFFNG